MTKIELPLYSYQIAVHPGRCMPKKVALQLVLKVISILLIIGGLVRLIATRQTFQSFMINELWVPQAYFIYIYRVLGAFVVFAGITMFVISQDPFRYSRVLQVWGVCFLFIGTVMFIAGYSLHMSLLHYAFDVIFCFIIAAVCFLSGKQRV